MGVNLNFVKKFEMEKGILTRNPIFRKFGPIFCRKTGFVWNLHFFGILVFCFEISKLGKNFSRKLEIWTEFALNSEFWSKVCVQVYSKIFNGKRFEISPSFCSKLRFVSLLSILFGKLQFWVSFLSEKMEFGVEVDQNSEFSQDLMFDSDFRKSEVLSRKCPNRLLQSCKKNVQLQSPSQ